MSAAEPQVGLSELVASDSAAVFVPPDNKENLKARIRPLRVAQVVSFYHPRIGGVETHVQSLAQGCAEAGDDVVVLTHQVGDAPAEEWIGAIRVLRFPMTVPARNYSLSLRLFSYLRRHAADFDVVHVHSYHTVIGHAAVRSRLPFVFTPHYHGTGHTPFRALLHRLYWPAGARLFRAADAVICVSEVERNLVIKDFPGIAGKVATIPNGTNQKLVTPDDGDVVSLGAEAIGPAAVAAQWRLDGGAVLWIGINLGAEQVRSAIPAGRMLFESLAGTGATAVRGILQPHCCCAFLETRP